MGRLVIAVLSVLALGGSATPPRALELRATGYQEADGAIPLRRGAAEVDPYFATKSLLEAHAAGLDVGAAGRAWVAWLLPRQLASGSFPRFCREGRGWRACRPADADDSITATWVELLHLLAPRGLPPQWRASEARALRHLASLRDPATGVYHLSARLPVALLMDNVEVYSALRSAGRAPEAAALARAIPRVFWAPAAGRWRVTTQSPAPPPGFYPDAVAQVFPVAERLPGSAARYSWGTWQREHAREWLSLGVDPYPWGMVALWAARLGDERRARCWLARAEPLRHGFRWNVLEEASYQALEARFGFPTPGDLQGCPA